MKKSNYTFFLGGYDLEMVTIRDLLKKSGIPGENIIDKQLRWGAKVSQYSAEIAEARKQGRKLMLIELENDIELEGGDVVIIDHHDKNAGIDKPTSLEQIWRLLAMDPRQWGRSEYADYPLIAANDRGHVRAMKTLGATQNQMAAIRARDRAAQGITEEEERQGKTAVANHEARCEGELILVKLPHNHTAVVSDLLHADLGGPGYRNLLVISPGEINFFGDGRWICGLDRTFPGGWYGGDLPREGYWGFNFAQPLVEWLESRISDTPPAGAGGFFTSSISRLSSGT